MSFDYSNEELVHYNWPNCEQGEDGMWRSIWAFEADSPPDVAIDWDQIGEEFTSILSGIAQEVAKSSTDVFATRLVGDGVHLSVHVTTLSHIINVEYMRALIEFIKLMDQRLGPIKTVQGQPRNLWPPWDSSTW